MRKFLLFVFALAVCSLTAYSQKPTPTPAPQPFLMAVEDSFYIAGRGVVATGKIERGAVKVGDALEIVGSNGITPTTVTGIEMFRKSLTEAKAGDNVGLLLRGVDKSAVARGDVIARPGSIKTFKRFKAKVDVLSTAEGGRAKPLPAGFRPLVEIRTGSFSGVMTFPAGESEAAPGEKAVEVEMEITQAAPLEKGTVIALREYGRTVAKGVVTALIPPK